MGIFDTIRENVTAKQVAEYYGLKVNRNGMACCPFHNDHHPSMKLDRRFHCFGCQADGDAVDFVEKMFGLTPKEAAFKIADDFHLDIEVRKTELKEIRLARIRKTKEKEYEENVRRTYAQELRQLRLTITDFFRTLHNWELVYSPTRSDLDNESVDERYITVVHYKDQLEYIIDTLDFGEDGEIYEIFKNREEIINIYERKITEALQRAN